MVSGDGSPPARFELTPEVDDGAPRPQLQAPKKHVVSTAHLASTSSSFNFPPPPDQRSQDDSIV